MSNAIHSTAIIGPHVRLGDCNRLGPYVVLMGHTTIGDRNVFQPGATLGGPSRQRIHTHRPRTELSGEPRLDIGNECVFFEQCSVHRPMGSVTAIGDRVSIGSSAHVAHDACIEDDTIISSGSIVGGYVTIQAFANIGIGAAIHQRMTVGAHALVGAGSTVVGHIAPGSVVAGVPARYVRPNVLSLRRHGSAYDEASWVQWLETGEDPQDPGVVDLVRAFAGAIDWSYGKRRFVPARVSRSVVANRA